MAMCMMAYMRDSCSGFVVGARHAVMAASPAFAFHVITALLSGASPAIDGA